MTGRLKPLATQVIVITGATSRIGMTTARMAAKQGARIVIAARDATALDQLAADLRRTGADVLALRVDIGVKDQLTALGRAALHRFGRIDTWVNNAGMVIENQTDATFKTEFWSTVHGAIVALGAMRQAGGAIVNLRAGDAAADDIKGFTNSLRAEIETDGVPVSVTLIRAINIDLPQPVAEAILYAAQHPKRDMLVGGPARWVDQFVDLLLFRVGREHHHMSI